MELKHYTQLAKDMINADSERDAAFLEYENMYHIRWELPAEMQRLEWVRAYRDSDPHDAIEAGVRTLATLAPSVTFTPLRNDPLTKRDANFIERNLSWQLKSANRRRASPIEADVVRSALLYGAVALNVIDLDQHIKQLKSMGKDTRRIAAARRVSRFVVNTFNPRSIHFKASNFGTQCVLLCESRRAAEVMDEWGLKKLGEWEPDDTIRYYDLTDFDNRCVWVDGGAGRDDQTVEIINGPHGLDFFPWVTLMGGSTLEDKPENQYHPILYSIRNSGQWRTKNVVMTLAVSEVIAHAASPRHVEEGPNADHATIDYGDPSRTAKAPPGNTIRPFPTPPIDQALTEVADRITAAMSKSTVSQVLQGAGLPSGVSFAAYNQATQNALSSLRPSKRLAEQALSEMLSLMLLWVKQTKTPLLAYGTDKRTDMGTEYTITPDDFDEAALYIETTLTEQVPTDHMQRANAASMMVQSIGYPKEYALEDVGVTDPQAALQQSYLERLVEFKFNERLKAESAELDIQIQQQTAQLQQAQQMQAEQAQMAQQQQAQAMSQQQAMTGPTPGGQGFNPAMGGIPPSIAFPQATRENMTGMDAAGNPMEGAV